MDHMARSVKQLGEIISKVRREKGMTQTELAERTGERQGTISNFENGKGLRLAVFLDILAAMDMEIVVRARTKGSSSEFEGIFQ